MPGSTYYTIEVQHCPGYVVVGGERVVELDRQGNDPDGQKWSVTSVFKPELQIIGFMLINAASGGALKFGGDNQPVEIGSPREPVEKDVVWDLTVHEDSAYLIITPVANDGQALDALLTKNTCQGGQLQSHGINRGDHQQWRMTPISD